MRKFIITICLVGSGIIILDSLQAGDALAMFLLAGIIPGTNIVISPTETLVLIALIAGFMVSRLTIPMFSQRFSKNA